jgi:hypothetical protein
MDNPGTLRRKASRLRDRARSSASADEATRLHETGQQLELWADDIETRTDACRQRASNRGNGDPT